MGLVQMPQVESYWSTSRLYSIDFGSVMSRNRFQLLTTMIHYSDNENADQNNRLYKLGTLIEDLMINANNCMVPEKSLYIDESIIPFTGRLLFKQFIKNKRHRYGIKLFKLCIPPNFTIAIKIYAGRESVPDTNISTKIVLELAEPYLDFGRTIVVDNWYISIELAERLGQRTTYLTGTLRTNRKSNPKEVVSSKLKKGETFSLRNSNNVMVLKWKDKRDLLICSTKDTNNMVTVVKRQKITKKPEAIINYNKGKGSID